MCHLGEVFDASLPSVMKIKSETNITLHPVYKEFTADLNYQESLLVTVLEKEHYVSLSGLQQLLQVSNAMPIVRNLYFKGIVMIKEEMCDPYKPKVEKHLQISPRFRDPETIQAALQILESKKSTLRQADLLTVMMSLTKLGKSVPKKKVMERANVGNSQIKALVDKQIVEEIDIIIDRWQLPKSPTKPYALTPQQTKAVAEAAIGIKGGKPVLIHGVTGSGKTLVYLELIKSAIAQGGQALYLVPEIALTAQLLARLASYFGGAIAVYHSRLSNNERYELWCGIQQGRYVLVVGARSSVFLPFSDLKIIVVDEEHEASFKQQDPAPRYHARDVAIYLAHSMSIPIILGSATPSLESYLHATNGKYHLVHMQQRHGEIALPALKTIDLSEAQKTKSVQGNITRELRKHMERHLTMGHQVILYQNRRGYAPQLECATCGHVPFCKNCDIALTYHKYNDTMSCHFCGFGMGRPQKCPHCGTAGLQMKGMGTERIEDELAEMFPNRRIARMDWDTTRKKNSMETLIQQVEDGEIDILVGTQMVSKGLDFDKVKLVGVLSGDSGMQYPDFRATERNFQLLTQVAGRSGRKGSQGEVFIQTYQPNHYLYNILITGEQTNFYQVELAQRKRYSYPPYVRLIRMVVRHPDMERVNRTADSFFTELTKRFDSRMVFGPEYGHSPRLKNKYNKGLFIKLPNDASTVRKAKEYIAWAIDTLKNIDLHRGVDFILDVDP
jgi:primosomal protein N' (replication factor Y)